MTQRDIICSWIERINIEKMTIDYPKQSADLMQSSSHYQGHFSQNQYKNLKYLYGNKKTSVSQSNLEKEKWSWGNQPSWLQTIHN